MLRANWSILKTGHALSWGSLELEPHDWSMLLFAVESRYCSPIVLPNIVTHYDIPTAPPTHNSYTHPHMSHTGHHHHPHHHHISSNQGILIT